MLLNKDSAQYKQHGCRAKSVLAFATVTITNDQL
jgi:hypothetical protein